MRVFGFPGFGLMEGFRSGWFAKSCDKGHYEDCIRVVIHKVSVGPTGWISKGRAGCIKGLLSEDQGLSLGGIL